VDGQVELDEHHHPQDGRRNAEHDLEKWGQLAVLDPLLPIEAVLWVGFALPFPWPERSAIIALAERSGR
jgi:hypothetical protein